MTDRPICLALIFRVLAMCNGNRNKMRCSAGMFRFFFVIPKSNTNMILSKNISTFFFGGIDFTINDITLVSQYSAMETISIATKDLKPGYLLAFTNCVVRTHPMALCKTRKGNVDFVVYSRNNGRMIQKSWNRNTIVQVERVSYEKVKNHTPLKLEDPFKGL